MKEPTVWTCPTCKSCRVQSQMWVRANTGELVDGTDRYQCDACEEDGNDGELKHLAAIPISETREAKLLAQREAQLLADDPAAPTQMEWECIELQELRAVLAEVAPKTEPAKPQPIIITMDGGVIQDIDYIPPGVDIVVMDFDVEGAEPDDERIKVNAAGDAYHETIW